MNDPSLVLWLPLNQLDGATFASRDVYGHLCTNTVSTWVPEGRSFDGASAYIDCGNASALKIGDNDLTVIISFKVDSDPAAAQIIFNKTKVDSAEMNYSIAILPGPIIRVYVNPADNVDSPVLAVSKWHRVGLIYHKVDAIIDLYLNGDLIGSVASGVATDNDYTVKVGCREGILFFEGLIDDVKLYRRALLPTEMARDYRRVKQWLT